MSHILCKNVVLGLSALFANITIVINALTDYLKAWERWGRGIGVHCNVLFTNAFKTDMIIAQRFMH